MSFVTTKLLPPHRHYYLSAAIRSLSPAIATVVPSSPLLSLSTNRSITSYKPRNPKIKITLDQLRMAARGQGRRGPICHDEHTKVMNALEAAKYEVCLTYENFYCISNLHQLQRCNPIMSLSLITPVCFIYFIYVAYALLKNDFYPLCVLL